MAPKKCKNPRFLEDTFCPNLGCPRNTNKVKDGYRNRADYNKHVEKCKYKLPDTEPLNLIEEIRLEDDCQDFLENNNLIEVENKNIIKSQYKEDSEI